MLQKHTVDLDWSTVFYDGDKEILIRQLQSANTEAYSFDKHDYISIPEETHRDEFSKLAREIVVLKFCIEDTDFARDVLSEEEFEKCSVQYSRKNYNSKLLKDLLSRFCYLLSRNNYAEDKEKLSTLLKLDILRADKELRAQQVEKAFLPLKKQVEKIASGVKGYCYFAAENPAAYGIRKTFECKIGAELNDFIKRKYSYDYNILNGNGNLCLSVLSNNNTDDINALFKRALYGDDEFWDKHKKFDIFAFLETVSEVNDLRHAEKIIDYIFSEISKIQYGREIIEKSLPLVFLKKQDFLIGLECRTFRFTFDRFKNYFDLQLLSGISLCYPFAEVEGAEIKLKCGKGLVEEFFKEIYPNDFDRVFNILKDEIASPSDAFSYRKQALCNVNGEWAVSDRDFDEWNIRHIFDYPTFGYHSGVVDRDAVTVFCPEYFSAENIWNRFYLKAFYMSEAVKDKKMCFADLFEVYYDLFQFIEEKTGIKTAYQRNTEGRTEAYDKLKKVLKENGADISDKFKTDYIVSLLDRKVAIKEEAERFPVLEQLGDAVYGLAVAEMMFFDGKINNIAKDFELFTCAKEQVKVAYDLGIDKLYLSSYSLPRKYERDVLINPDDEAYVLRQEREQLENGRKYLADSLEMVIGTICKDCGYKIALDFTKKLIKKAYPPEYFPAEIRWKDREGANVDKDYWTKILPSPYSRLDNAQLTMWLAFDKFFKAYVLGTEDIAARSYITNRIGDSGLYEYFCNDYEVNQVFYEYLHSGLERAIEKYADSVKQKYKNL